MPQNAIFAPLSATIPATSHLGLLGFKLENDENMSKDFHNLYQRFFIF